MKIDYNKQMEEIINTFDGVKKKLLIHSCCAPCNSHVLISLEKYFEITVYFYNPNINIPGEFEKRYKEQEKFINESKIEGITLIKGDFNPKDFYNAIKGFESLGENSQRCVKCFNLRLEEASKMAKNLNMDYFTTSLTISPMKNSEILNEIGYSLENIYKVNWLPSDFKKKSGYQNSIKLSKDFNLYRQNYCGCSFSKFESEKKEKL